MSTSVAFPFRTIPPDAIRATPWSISLDNGDTFDRLGDHVVAWDPSISPEIQRKLTIEPTATAKALNVPQTAMRLVLITEVGTGWGRFPARVLARESQELGAGSSLLETRIRLPGRELSGNLFVQQTILFGATATQADPLAPKHPESRVWGDAARARLEGHEPRIAMTVADLSSRNDLGTASEAPWLIEWRPAAWDRDFLQAVRIVLNARHPQIVERVEGEDPLTLQAIMGDLAVQVCESLLHNEEFLPHPNELPEGSIGAQSIRWLELAFPEFSMHETLPLSDIREVLEQRPGQFRAALLALFSFEVR